MKTFLIVTAAAALAGCAQVATVRQDFLQAAKPIVMCTLAGEAYVVQANAAIPFGQRLPEADGLCKLQGAKQ